MTPRPHSRLRARLRAGTALPAASLTGYGMVVGLIAVGAITAVAGLGGAGSDTVCRAQRAMAESLGSPVSPGCADVSAVEAADLVPDPFAFSSGGVVVPGSVAVSDPVVLTGFNRTISASVALTGEAGASARPSLIMPPCRLTARSSSPCLRTLLAAGPSR